MRPGSVAIVGASETNELGEIKDKSEIQLHAEAAINAMRETGLKPSDIDGIATAGTTPSIIAHYLGIKPGWADGTMVGGCSFLLHVRHAAAAIAEGMCSTVLITHGQSGRSNIAQGGFVGGGRASLQAQFESPYGIVGPTTMFTLPVLRFLKETGTTIEQLANVAVVQREWASRNPRAKLQELTSVEEVLSDRMIAYPFTRAMCCLVTDGGGALILTSAERAQDFPTRPVYLLGTGESVEMQMISQMYDKTRSTAFRISGKKAFDEAGISHDDADHLMIYDAFAHLPLYGLEDLGFCGRGEAGAFIEERHTAPGGSLPTNTNGGGLSYTHSGMYGMFALQESVRQMRGTAPAQVEGAKISVCHGVGGMFYAAGTIIMSNERP